MQLNLDKTVVLVAATRALADLPVGYEAEQLQTMVDILSSEQSKFIRQTIGLDDYEYSLIECYLEEV